MRSREEGKFYCDRCLAELEPNESIPGWACWTCGVEYRITSVEEDQSSFTVVAAPLPGFGVCDFCGARGPKWSYPCGNLSTDFVALKDGQVVQHDTHHSVDDWAACEDCAAYIEADDQKGMTHRAAEAMAKAHGVPERAKSYEMQITELHEQFWAARNGPREPIEVPI